MKLPWNQKQKIQSLKEEKKQLKQKIESLEKEKNNYKKRFEAEKERRSQLSAEKQEAQEKVNKLQQKIQSLNTKDSSSSESEGKGQKAESREAEISDVQEILQKIQSIKSPEKDLLTIYAPQTVKDLPDVQGLKGSISGENYEFVSEDSGFVAFVDEDFIQLKLKSRPFFSPSWKLSNGFDVNTLTEFIQQRKQWAAVSAGETVIYEEKGGEILERNEVSSRVDSKQKKGGFSQGRFERKRQEQIDEHLNMVEGKISEDTFLVGEKSLCKKLSGNYIGGFDHEKGSVDVLYNFRMEVGQRNLK